MNPIHTIPSYFSTARCIPTALLKKIRGNHHLTSASTAEIEETAGARQRLGKNVLGATNTPATTEELLDAVSSVRSVSYQMLKM
jgi:hypothetical protein